MIEKESIKDPRPTNSVQGLQTKMNYKHNKERETVRNDDDFKWELRVMWRKNEGYNDAEEKR